MNITDVRIRNVVGEGRLRAVASVTFDDELAVHDMKIIEGQDRYFLAMPARKTRDNSFRDIVHPINARVREELERRVIEQYMSSLEQNEQPASDDQE
jgi:stage V sporulation protein G